MDAIRMTLEKLWGIRPMELFAGDRTLYYRHGDLDQKRNVLFSGRPVFMSLSQRKICSIIMRIPSFVPPTYSEWTRCVPDRSMSWC